jgi:hypothetical protein
MLLILLVLASAHASIGEKEGVQDILQDEVSIENSIKVCKQARVDERTRFGEVEKEFHLLAPPGVTKPCENVLDAMQDGEWSYDMAICDSPIPMLNTLCSNNRTVGYGTIDKSNKRSAWRPNKCALKIFTAAQACEILHKAAKGSSSGTGLVVSGESLQRHTYQGLLQILSGDYEYGSMQCGEKYAECVGEKQYNEKVCSTAKRKALITGCDKKNELITYLELWNIMRWESGYLEKWLQDDGKGGKRIDPNSDWKKTIKSLSKDGLFLFAVGMHDGLSWQKATHSIAEPLMKFMNTLPEDERPHIMWQSVHAQGKLKPKQFKKSQGNGQVKGYNKGMAATAKRLGFEVFDAFKVSEGAHSFDGTHYGLTFSVYRGQLLLNYLYQHQNPGK